MKLLIRLLQLILDGCSHGDQSPTIDSRETEETSILLTNYPFPITKGCYLAIEKEYGNELTEGQQSTLQELIHILHVRNTILSSTDCSSSYQTSNPNQCPAISYSFFRRSLPSMGKLFQYDTI